MKCAAPNARVALSPSNQVSMIASASAAPATNGFDLPSGQMRERLTTYRGFVQQSIIRKQLTGDNEMRTIPRGGMDARRRESGGDVP